MTWFAVPPAEGITPQRAQWAEGSAPLLSSAVMLRNKLINHMTKYILENIFIVFYTSFEDETQPAQMYMIVKDLTESAD